MIAMQEVYSVYGVFCAGNAGWNFCLRWQGMLDIQAGYSVHAGWLAGYAGSVGW
jgi:hypothetical protein